MESNKQLQARFQKVNLLDYKGDQPLKIAKADQSHRVFTTYNIDGLNQTEDPISIDFTVKKASNIKLLDKEKDQPAQHKRSLQFNCNIEEEALLFFDKREIIPSDNSNINQHIKVNVTEDAEFIWSEIVHLDEVSDYHYYSLMEIWAEEQCLAYDPVQFDGSEEMLAHHGMTESYPYVASIWYISPDPPFDEWDVQQRLSQAKNHRAGMTDIDGKGILIRWLSTDLTLLKQEMDDVLAFFDEKITELRKWRV
ncbi:Urease accessory protein UreH [Gracilibacillus orientalis]|uniref:Urease accessory protein UreH n=1 Tax=Gracilibacillus orientalis TaxID=334253 RepID=A0A1I4HKG7_9BACI|nr:urease accessory protein UreD [Gracilibacillus orientalis]SFL42808.1 Urease accessory protein UreH [Gracilibacillus orientalis]